VRVLFIKALAPLAAVSCCTSSDGSLASSNGAREAERYSRSASSEAVTSPSPSTQLARRATSASKLAVAGASTSS